MKTVGDNTQYLARCAKWSTRWTVVFFLGLGLLTFARVARAALQFDVFLGYDGIAREASWMPVVCEIKNDGPSFNGVVEVSPGQFGRGQTEVLPVELPTGTLKRVVIPVFSPSRYPSIWDVRLLDERGKVRAEQTALRPSRQIGWEIPLIGSLSRTVAGTPVVQRIKRDQADAQPASARFQPAIFPDNPLVLEGLDAIYLSSEVAVNLRVGQVNALLAWMNAGGNLIVGIEQISDVTASPWLRGILPCEPKDTKTIGAHTELQTWLRGGGWAAQSWPTPRGRATYSSASADSPFADLPDDTGFELADLQVVTGALRDGRVTVSAGDTPLIITANRGAGRVTALMFSPEREPFKSWKNLPVFWAKLLGVPGQLYVSSDYYSGYGQSTDGIFGAMIDSRQVHKLPIGWLLLLLVVYLVIIGPLDQWWLKRIGKPMLTWITFPCYVVLFSLLIYFIGYKLRAGESEFNELHVVDVLRNGDHAELRGRTYASIYSPSNQKFPLESRQKYATFRGEFLSSGGGAASERMTVWQTGDSFKAEVFVPVWTSQLYISDWWDSAPLPLTATVTEQGNSWRVTVVNNTDHAVKTARLVVDERIFPLGEVPAGKSASFTVGRGAGQSLREFTQRYGTSFHMVVQQRQYAFGASSGGRLTDLPDSSMAASFVTQLGHAPNSVNFVVPPGLDLSAMVERGRAVLLAWSPDYSPVKPINQFKSRRGSQYTLWRVPIDLKLK
jgi:hypothetical protein